MQILTPENAAFLPSGSGSNLIVSANYSFEETAVADFGPIYDNLIVPQDGNYIFATYMKILASDDPNGTFVINIWNPLLATSLSSFNLTPSVAGGFGGAFVSNAISSADGVIQVGRQLSGFLGTSITYRVTASAIRLC